MLEYLKVDVFICILHVLAHIPIYTIGCKVGMIIITSFRIETLFQSCLCGYTLADTFSLHDSHGATQLTFWLVSDYAIL